MNFCKQCDNLYYTKIQDENQNKLILYCKQCGDENSELTNSNIISNKNTTQKYIINEFTKLDPTLPHITNIPCPNENCKTNTEQHPKDVIYIKYNELEMKYIYLCTVCNTNWELNK